VVDIYLPDMKYASETEALNLSLAPGYPELNRIAVAEMLRQVGQLQTDCQGIATSGVIVRHLLLPKDRGGSAETLAWVAANLGTATPIALMSQYFPAHLAIDAPGLNRRVTRSEYLAAVKALESNELGNGWLQEEPQQG
jgi:putative pyruvate formate lyase activating enzyme